MLSLVVICSPVWMLLFQPMRALEFIRSHVTFKLPYEFSYQMKTPLYQRSQNVCFSKFSHILFQNVPRSWICMAVFIGLIYSPLSSTTLSYTQLLKWGHSNILVCKCILEINKKSIIKTSHSSKYLGRPLGQNLVQFDAKVKVCLHCKYIRCKNYSFLTCPVSRCNSTVLFTFNYCS